MSKLKEYFIFLFWIIAIVSCQKDSNESITGTFVGTFTVKYPNSMHSGSTTVNFKDNGQYYCTANTGHIPAGGSGSFTRTDSKMIFTDSSIWTANFDGFLILNFDYDYSFDGSNLKLSAVRNNIATYEYNLIKQ
jgi:hypothetical protein